LALLGSAIWEGGLAVENTAERGAVPIMPNDPNAELVEVKGELKKMNKQLRQLIELKKQANLMAGCFFVVKLRSNSYHCSSGTRSCYKGSLVTNPLFSYMYL
jgi:hypothetical protein